MRKIILALGVVFLFSCRQDESIIKPASGSVNGGDGYRASCLITKSTSSTGEIKNIKYDENAIPLESISSSGESHYIIVEKPKQLLYFKGGKSSDEVKSRIYMTDFGSVQKEVAVHVGDDGKTIVEDKNQVDTYYYNSKKLLTKIDKAYGEDRAIIELTYDDKDRVNRIVIKDPGATMVLFEYTNFTYLDRKKNDNIYNISFIESYSSALIPCLQNVYITSYKMKMMPGGFGGIDFGEIDFGGIDLGEINFDTDYKNEFTFDGNKVTTVKTTVTALGIANSYINNLESSCK